MPRRWWILKSEPDAFSFQDLMDAPGRTTPWDGVRNYQARNFMRDEMRVGDAVLFYHSGPKAPGVVGLAEVASEPYPDPSQFDPSSRYHDAASDEADPRWVLVDIRGLRPLGRVVALAEIKADPRFEGMLLTRRGTRLSVMPVDAPHAEAIVALGDAPAEEA